MSIFGGSAEWPFWGFWLFFIVLTEYFLTDTWFELYLLLLYFLYILFFIFSLNRIFFSEQVIFSNV